MSATNKNCVPVKIMIVCPSAGKVRTIRRAKVLRGVQAAPAVQTATTAPRPAHVTTLRDMVDAMPEYERDARRCKPETRKNNPKPHGKKFCTGLAFSHATKEWLRNTSRELGVSMTWVVEKALEREKSLMT